MLIFHLNKASKKNFNGYESDVSSVKSYGSKSALSEATVVTNVYFN